MVKDLRTRPVVLRVGKCQQLTLEEESKWGLYQTQTFLPSLEALFKTDTLPNSSVYGLKLTDPIQKVVSPTTIQTVSGKQVDVHRKTTSILNVFRWMRGDYGSLGLPMPQETSKSVIEKLQSPHTAAYVGALASIVLSESDCPHFPKVFGVYCGMARKFIADISDDYEDLTERPWFVQNIGKTFEISMKNSIATPGFQHTRGQRPTMEVGDDALLSDISELDGGMNTLSTPHVDGHLEEEAISHGVEDEEDDDDASSDSTDDVYAIESCDCSSQGSFIEDGDGEEPESFAWAEIANLPVVTTVMEKCQGTIYELLKKDTDPAHHVAYMSQVIFALAYAQRTFGLVHNDLHGNNVMYVETDQAVLHYNLEGVLYSVPTHGYLIKLIDFDRATFSVRLQGLREPKHFVSDQFQEDEEAGGQYNVEPFYNPKVPEIRPNPSFDLVRLATSLFWDMFPEGFEDTSHPLHAILIRWMTLPDQTSVLFGRTNPKHDRYHGFDQYKAIARYCKDTAIPRKESLISQFKVDKIPIGSSMITIEA